MFQTAGDMHTGYTEIIPEIPDTIAADDKEFIVTSEGLAEEWDLEQVLVTMFSS